MQAGSIVGALAKLIMTGCLSMLIGSLSTISVAQEYQGNGRVTMLGEVLDSACALGASSAYQVIDMNLLSMGSLIRQRVSEPRAFKLRLVKCSLTRPDPARPGANLPDWQHLRVTFDGVADSNGRDFAVLGAASGLALRITDSKGLESIPGVPMPLISLSGNDQELQYTLQLVGNGRPMVAGSHRTALRFRLEYF